jgi:hypothetical protein
VTEDLEVCALYMGLEIAGLPAIDQSDHEPPLCSNVVTTTLQIRRSSRGLILNSYVFVSDDGGDYKFFLDSGRPNSNGECPVVVLGPGADAVVIAEDFCDFVIRSFEGTVSFIR